LTLSHISVDAAVPAWLLSETFGISHNPNCPKPWLVRLIGPGKGMLDNRTDYAKSEDILGFGTTCVEAAEAAKRLRELARTALLRQREEARALRQLPPPAQAPLWSAGVHA